MPIENDDIEFKELLEDKRHKELKSSINNLAVAVGQKSNKEIVDAIEKSTSNEVRGFAEAIKLLAAPKVEVNVDYKSLNELGDKILKNQVDILEVLNKIFDQNEIMKEYKVEFKRGGYNNDLIQSPFTFKQVK